MYYYIVDPPGGVGAVKIAQRLQELITPMGISGEVAVANPARSAEELAYMGIDKGYTTIVAVGGEELANTITSILLNESREKIAFGVIPINAGPLLSAMIGVANNDIRGGVETIKQRHLDLADVVQIGTKRFMITEAYIVSPRTIKITLDIDQTLKAETEANSVHISHDLVMTFQVEQSQSLINKIFGGKHADNLTSQFHGKQIRVIAHEPLGVMIAGQVIAKTPTTFTKIPGALKLITARATLPSKSINDFSHRPATLEQSTVPPTQMPQQPERTV